ncbi:MAG: cupin domain-containing protein [Pseudomonadota bacterium]
MILRSVNQLPFTEVSHNTRIPKKVLLANSEISGITNFSIAHFPVGECARAHTHHDMTEVFYVNRGTANIRIDESDHPLSAGDCIVVEPGESHELSNTGDTVLELIYFGVVTEPKQ